MKEDEANAQVYALQGRISLLEGQLAGCRAVRTHLEGQLAESQAMRENLVDQRNDLREQLSDVRALREGEAGEWDRLVSDLRFMVEGVESLVATFNGQVNWNGSGLYVGLVSLLRGRSQHHEGDPSSIKPEEGEQMSTISTEGRHPSTVRIAKHFAYDHLPERLTEPSRLCANLAQKMLDIADDGPELTTGLRKLLEAKDCFVRALLEQGQS